MKKLDDPARLLEPAADTTEDVRAVLRSGQRGLPGPDELARLAARLPLGRLPPMSRVGGGPQTPGPGSRVGGGPQTPGPGSRVGGDPQTPGPAGPLLRPAPTAAPSVLPGAIVGAVLALGALLVLGVVRGQRAAEPSPAAASAAPEGAASVAAPLPDPRPAELRPVELRPVEPGRADPRLESPDPGGGGVSSARPSGAPPVASADTLPGSAPSPTPSDAPSPGASPGTGETADAETEVHLLQRAQTALGADPRAALALTGEHARRFPGGALVQERELIAVTALVALGRKPEAQSRATSLLERFPSSAYRGRLESLGL